METFQEILDLDLDRVTLLHTLSMGLDLTVIEKQFLLEAGTLESQGKRLLELLHSGAWNSVAAEAAPGTWGINAEPVKGRAGETGKLSAISSQQERNAGFVCNRELIAES